MKYILVSILLIISLIAGCQTEPQIVLEEIAKNQFAKLQGKIGITLETNAAKWHRVFDRGALVKVDSLPAAPKKAAAIEIGWFYGAMGLPEYSGYDYKGPYLVSPRQTVCCSVCCGNWSINTRPNSNCDCRHTREQNHLESWEQR
jgi:hypothetical protein